MRLRLTLVSVLAGALSLSIGEAPATATVSCAYDQNADTLTITADADDDIALLGATSGGEISVFDGVANATRACTGAGGPPTVTNTTAVNLTDAAVSSSWNLIDPEMLVNAGAEIDVVVALGNEFDRFTLIDGNLNVTDDFWTLGASGINWNGDTDAEISFLTEVDEITMGGGGGADAITAQGGHGTGAIFAGPAKLTIAGGEGEDVLWGGNARDALLGDRAHDTLAGFAGDDDLDAGPGVNQLDGGAGTDTAEFDQVDGPVTADLAAGAAMKAGDGTDTLTAIEVVVGSTAGDTLRGDANGNALFGSDGSDTLIGRGGTDSLYGSLNSSVPGPDGNDTLDGGPGADDVIGEEGIDTATYAGAPAAVSVDLGAGSASGGDGTDGVGEVENLIGSPFGDTLTGSGLANSITGLGGNDIVSALAGPDSVNVRDGGPDTASCGTEVDSATADRTSVDSVNADCENVSFLPEAGGGGAGGGGGGDGGGAATPADTAVSFDLGGKKRQRVLEQKGVIVTASCPAEDCTAAASGKARVPETRRSLRAKLRLKPVTETLAAGVAERIKLRLRRKQRRRVAAALRGGTKPKIRVTASVADAAGNAASDVHVVTARR